MRKSVLIVLIAFLFGCGVRSPEPSRQGLKEIKALKEQVSALKEQVKALEGHLEQVKDHNKWLRNELEGLTTSLRSSIDAADTKAALNTTYLMETSMAHVKNYLQSIAPRPNGYDGGYDDCYRLTTIIEHEDSATQTMLRERVMPIGELPPEVINACNIIMGNEY